MFNGVTFNGTTFNGGQPGAILKTDAESTAALGDDDVLDLGDETAERLWLNPEGDRPGVRGGFNSFTFNGLPFNSAQRIVGADWEILADVSDAESTQAISETQQVIQSIVLDLSAPGTSFIALTESPLSFVWELNKRARASFMVKYPGDAASYYVPHPGHQAEFTGFDSTVWFAGSIETTRRVLKWQPSGDHKAWVNCDAVGWEQIADRFLCSDAAHQVYDSQNLDVIAGDLVSTYLAADGITATGLPTGVTVSGKVVFNYTMRISDCLDELSKRTGYWWRIDTSKNLVFYASGTAGAAALAITASSNNYVSIEAALDRGNYRNRQYLSNVVVTNTPAPETFAGDLTNQAFTLKYDVYSVPTITVNGSPATVGIRDIDAGKDFYWSKGSPDIVPATGAARTGSDSVVVTYTGQYETVRRITDSGEVTDRANIEGGTGIYEAIQGDGVVLTTATSADDYAQSLIDRNAPIPSVVTIVVDTSGALPAMPGQYVSISLPKLDLSGNFFVRRVAGQVFGKGDHMRCTIEASSNEPEESWAASFKRKTPPKDMTGVVYTAG